MADLFQAYQGALNNSSYLENYAKWLSLPLGIKVQWKELYNLNMVMAESGITALNVYEAFYSPEKKYGVLIPFNNIPECYKNAWLNVAIKLASNRT